MQGRTPQGERPGKHRDDGTVTVGVRRTFETPGEEDGDTRGRIFTGAAAEEQNPVGQGMGSGARPGSSSADAGR